MKIKTYIDYYVTKRITREEEREVDLHKFKDFISDESIDSEEDLKDLLQDFFWEEDAIIVEEDKTEEWDINEFYITDASELLSSFGITCCSLAAKTDKYCRICGKQLRN